MLFLSLLLGMTLKKWHDNPRFWNQIKGRIFSKFSFNKMASLTEIGLYNFISLFLTLTISADLEEVVSIKIYHYFQIECRKFSATLTNRFIRYINHYQRI